MEGWEVVSAIDAMQPSTTSTPAAASAIMVARLAEEVLWPW